MDAMAEGLVVLSASCNTWFVVKLIQRGSFTAPFVFLMHLTSELNCICEGVQKREREQRKLFCTV